MSCGVSMNSAQGYRQVCSSVEDAGVKHEKTSISLQLMGRPVV